MSRWISLTLTALLLVLTLAACGGGDDDDTDPTATATTESTTPATATATETTPSGSGDAAASPTAKPTDEPEPASPTAASTAPSRPIATPTPTAAPPTPTPTDDSGFSDLETAMLDALLQPEDLVGDWTQLTYGLMEEDTDDSDELCLQPPFPDRDLRMAGVEVEYELNAEVPAAVLENLVLFPVDTAVEAIAYARDISDCGTWTDPDGQTYTVTPLDAETYGEESYTASLQYDFNGTPIYGEYTFIRVGGAIATVVFITLDGSDVTELRGIVGIVADRLASSGLGNPSASLQPALLDVEDMALIDDVNVWTIGNAIDATDDERFAVCEAASFPDVLGAAIEAGHELEGNTGDGPFAMHSIVRMLDDEGALAMDFVRSELSCGSWTDEDANYELTDTGDLEVGDDTYWLIVTITAINGGDQAAQVGFGFTQIGDYISVVGLAAADSLDPELFGAMIALGAEKVMAVAP